MAVFIPPSRLPENRLGSVSDFKSKTESEDKADKRDNAGPELLQLLYADLRQLAVRRMAGLRPGQTLQPTALVHEAYLRLVKKGDPGWNGRGHFFAAAAQAMRDILVEQARKKASLKRGGDQRRVDMTVTFADGDRDMALSAEELLTLNQALERMQEAHPRKAEIVLLRYFGGLTIAQIAEVFDVATRTIEREWRFARAWLQKELGSG